MNTETTKKLRNKPGAWIAITTERNKMNTETTKQLQGKLIDACDAMLGLVNMSSEQLVKIVSLERELAEANSKIIALTKSHDVVTRTFSQVDNELAEARQELSEWKTLQSWGGTPQIVDEFIKGQQTRIHAAQDAEGERDALAEALDEVLEDYVFGGCVANSTMRKAEQSLDSVKGGFYE
jgi:hypothetical protein